MLTWAAPSLAIVPQLSISSSRRISRSSRCARGRDSSNVTKRVTTRLSNNLAVFDFGQKATAWKQLVLHRTVMRLEGDAMQQDGFPHNFADGLSVRVCFIAAHSIRVLSAAVTSQHYTLPRGTQGDQNADCNIIRNGQGIP
jgi:hypothetical protein